MSLAERVLAALTQHEQEKPRSQQVQLGPSELGSCREYVRNAMIGTPRQEAEAWPGAAVVGTLVGEYVEEVLAERWGIPTQVPVTTELPNGLKVSGHADIVMPEENRLADVKTKDQLAGVERDGASIDNQIQVSIYTLGLVQKGVLTAGATAHLLYIDRSGNQQYIHEIVLEWEDILHWIDVCVERLNDVLDAQDHIDKGEVEWARDLRDKTPPFCYSEKVLCPYRDQCWKGSEWVPHEEITDPETIATVEAFVRARDDQNASIAARRTLREQLRGVTGITPSGHSVVWSGGGDNPALYVTKVKR